MPLTEADIEHIALEWFAECGYACVHGPDIAPGGVRSANGGMSLKSESMI